MKSKGAVKFFAIALAVVCLFQLSFTFVANYYEGKAESYANGNKEKKRHYLDSLSRKPVYNLLLRKYNFMDVKERKINLGLDLRGGMHVTLAVAMNEFVKQLSGNNDDPAFNKALAKTVEEQKNSQRNFIDLFYENMRKQNPNVKLAQYFATLENKENISFSSSNDEVIAFLKKESQSALERTFNILRTRIDKFGVTQPNIQPDYDAGRIIVELPGADDPERVRKYLQGSAKLEFYETYTLAELYPFLQDADKELFAIQEAEKATKGGSSNKADTTTTAKNDLIPTAKKDTTTSAGMPLAGGKKDSLKTAEAKNDSTRKETPLLTALFAFGLNQDMAQSSTVGYVPIADTAKVNKLLAIEAVKNAFPPDVKFAWSAKPMGGQSGELLELTALKTTGLEGEEAALTGDVITDARKDLSQQGANYEVSMQMNTEGAARWAQITKQNIGKSIAIVLDDQVFSAPRVNNEIPGGRSQITGNFTANEANDLANILKAGKLPVRVQIIEEAVVGPSLGQDSINKGLLSLFAGLIAIIIFMVVYYQRSGWVANIALLINLFFLIGVLTSLSAALTLPGMAGILLTLAMAVDANVLIYERIREELAHGKSVKLAVAEGFKNAMASIVDGNLTTLLVGIILLAFGSGPVYGFAVVLVIGILTSMFTSILISRLIFDWLLEKEKKVTFGSMNPLRGINFDFVGKRKYSYIFSGVTILIGIISLTFHGLNYGVEFKGGQSFVVGFNQAAELSEVRENLTKTFEGRTPEVKVFGEATKLNIITDYLVDDNSPNASEKVKTKLMEGLAQYKGAHILSSQKVGSSVATDIKNSALSSIIFSLLGIFLYIVIRFKSWQFAAGATLALAHDVFFVVSIFSIFKDIMPFSMDIDQAIVAALLTICGYSINDTVVVFDRIREHLNMNKRAPMIPVINRAINETLSRTIITSLTVFIAVVILFIFGGQVIKGFAFAMMIGVALGTYSSIFVATPLAVDFQKKSDLDATTPNPVPAKA